MRGPEPVSNGRSVRRSRTRCTPRGRAPGALRPTDVVGAFFLAGLAFVLAGAIVAVAGGVVGWSSTRWLALHLIFVGGISQLVLGASQFFAGAFLATDPPARKLVRAQVAGWNSGSLLLAAGVVSTTPALIGLAASVLLGVLATYASALVQMRRRALQTQQWATRWYLLGAALFAPGIVAGAALAIPLRWPHGDLLAAHMALNVIGWFGTAIVGTLHTFYPSLTRTVLPLPRLQPWTFRAWAVGVVLLAVGSAWAVDPLASAGWVALEAASAILVVQIVRCVAIAPRPLSLPALIVGAGQLFLLAGLVVAAAVAAVDGPAQAIAGSTRTAIGILLIGGWVGLTVLGSLVHLLAVVLRVRDLTRPMPMPRPRRDAATAAAAAIGVTVLAASHGASLDAAEAPAAALLLTAYAVLAARILKLAAGVVANARPKI